MSKTIEEISKIAAEWWADKVASPKFDNGDNSMTGFMGMGLASMLVKPVEEGVKEKFIDALSAIVVEKLQNRPSGGLILDVDYGPCMQLRHAAEISGLSVDNFPWKTVMWIDENHVSASYGYRAEQQFLYSNKEYWRKRIEDCQKCIDGYKDGSALYWIGDEIEKKKHAAEMIPYYEADLVECKSNYDSAED